MPDAFAEMMHAVMTTVLIIIIAALIWAMIFTQSWHFQSNSHAYAISFEIKKVDWHFPYFTPAK